ncbi:carboxypeptidase-like regulatory domain-containing protein [Thermogutta sp.]|uniref:carboxypeptidase-like regulatory domain-containing protein n=1 Tax=Thermogutta sp. TaxID=1962930 RepID=UPI003220151B
MRHWCVFLGCIIAVLVGGYLWAGETASAPAPRVIDVALHDGGVLLGQVVTPEGRPIPQTTVAVENGQQQLLGVVKTDDNGRFAIKGLSGGVYRLSAANGTGTYRLWSPRTAPPGAQQATLIVAGQDISRGQALSRIGQWMRNPWIVGGAIATAIAVPVAVAEHEEGPSSP